MNSKLCIFKSACDVISIFKYSYMNAMNIISSLYMSPSARDYNL